MPTMFPLRALSFAAAAVLTLAAGASAAPAAATGNSLTIHADKPGAVINKNVYGQFSEHLGTGIYSGIYVGEKSSIPNTRGFRNDVIGALKQLHVPMVRWPGGCFADEYHWREGIGPKDKRAVRVNHNWGSVPEDNSFGTHEFFDFIDMIGADAYVNANVGTGSPAEAVDWLEYMTGDQDTTLVRERKANGRDKPWKVAVYAIGNETWGCGGNMRPEYYADLFKQYTTFIRMPKETKPLILASGGNDRRIDYTETLMKNVKYGMDAISFHYYTIPGEKWEHKGASTGFPASEWTSTMAHALDIDGMIKANVDVMNKYDPAKKVGFYVDEWGTWYDPDPGSNPGFLVQQNTVRDALVAAIHFNIFHKYADRVRMTSIAQTVNVLQAMILTDGEKMLLTPTYYVYQMYVPFQDATSLPIDIKSGTFVDGKYTVPEVTASAAKTKAGTIVVALANLNPNKPSVVSTAITGGKAMSVSGKVLTGPKLDSRNTFDAPNAVHPVAFDGAKLENGKLTVTLPPKSVVVLEIK